MKRTKTPKNNIENKLNRIHKMESILFERTKYANRLGMSYGATGTDRDLYQALGYKQELNYDDYYAFYKRDGVAKILIDKFPKAVWHATPEVSEVDTTTTLKPAIKVDTGFEKDYRELTKGLRLYNKLLRLDKLLGLGRYAILFMGFNDSDDLRVPVSPSNTLKLNYVHPYSENAVSISSYERDPKNERFGLPTMYSINISTSNNAATTLPVHWTRVIHTVEDALENDVFGTPRLQAAYNYIYNIEKIGGGSAEMFWRGARPGYAAVAAPETNMANLDTEDMQDQFDEYEHNLRRVLTLQGVDMKSLETQVASPKDHLDAQLELISITYGVPKRILLGSERGELASSQDMETWNITIHERMVNWAEPAVLRPFVDRCIEFGVLTEPKNTEYVVEWPTLSVIGEKDKADILRMRAEAIAKYVMALGADMLVPPEVFLRDEMGYDQETVLEIMKYMQENPIEEEEVEVVE